MATNGNGNNTKYTNTKFALHTILNRLSHDSQNPLEGLHASYAYLIRSSVRMTQLYPLLGELILNSQILTRKCLLGPWIEARNNRGPNFIGTFIDDDYEAMVNALFPAINTRAADDKNKRDFSSLHKWINQERATPYHCPNLARWISTDGFFQSAGDDFESLLPNDTNHPWRHNALPGSGNPMLVYRKLRRADQELKPCGSKTRNPDVAETVRLHVISTLSNLYRSIGISETAALIKTLLQNLVWPKPDAILFAILQEGVMNSEETAYLESFFDGIIQVDHCSCRNHQFVNLRVLTLPQLWKLPPPVLYQAKPLDTGKETPHRLRELNIGASFMDFYAHPSHDYPPECPTCPPATF